MDADTATGGERGGFGYPRAVRITSPAEIRALFRRGKRRRTRHLDVFVSPSPVAHARLGLVVPKHKRRGVDRNRLKRHLREAGRLLLLPRLGEGGVALDVMLRARPEAYGATGEVLRAEVAALAEELCSRGR